MPWDVVVAIALSIYIWKRHTELAEAIREAIDNFRGGPPTGMHPSPADDGVLVLRRRKKTEA
jgi:hypothetical protein